MHIEIPSEVCLDSLREDVNDIGTYHGDMVLESILADELHESLQVRHTCHGDTSIHAVGVVGHLALSEISLDASEGVVGRDTEVCELSLSTFSIYSPEGAHLAESASEDTKRSEFYLIAYE